MYVSRQSAWYLSRQCLNLSAKLVALIHQLTILHQATMIDADRIRLRTLQSMTKILRLSLCKSFLSMKINIKQ